MNATEVAAWKAQGELFVGSVSLMCPAWAVIDVSPLRQGATHRGTDVLIPGVAGRVGMPRRKDATAFQLPMVIDCTVDRTGAATASVPAGLMVNVDYLEANVSGPVATGTGTRTVTLGSKSGAAHVSMQLGEQIGPLRRAVLTLDFPGGGIV